MAEIPDPLLRSLLDAERTLLERERDAKCAGDDLSKATAKHVAAVTATKQARERSDELQERVRFMSAMDRNAPVDAGSSSIRLHL